MRKTAGGNRSPVRVHCPLPHPRVRSQTKPAAFEDCLFPESVYIYIYMCIYICVYIARLLVSVWWLWVSYTIMGFREYHEQSKSMWQFASGCSAFFHWGPDLISRAYPTAPFYFFRRLYCGKFARAQHIRVTNFLAFLSCHRPPIPVQQGLARICEQI